MRQPQIGNYGWTPQQMARVNAQREARGRAPLVNQSMGDQGYSDDYDRYYEEIQKKKSGSNGIKKSQYDIEKERQKGLSKEEIEQEKEMALKKKEEEAAALKRKREAEQSAFRERFRKKQSVPSQMSGLRGAVSSPSLGNYNLV